LPKIKVVGLMGWLVANTKTKRKKNNQKSIEGPENVNFQFFEKCFFQFFSFCPKDLAYQKSRFHNKKCGLRHCRKNCPKLESPKAAPT